MEDRMMRVAGSEDFHSSEYKSKITSIVTKGDTIIPEGVIESWDISEKQNGSVIAYAEDDGTGSGTYKVTIGGEGKIIANYDMSSYFGFTNCTTMDLTYLDTSLTTDMSYMFGSFIPNNSLNIIIFGDDFNTSKVTTMSMMFAELESLTTLNLSNFDTSNVTDMSAMFWWCTSLSSLDLSNFDTSNVISTYRMFAHTTNITEILVTRDKWTIPNSVISNSGVTDFTYV